MKSPWPFAGVRISVQTHHDLTSQIKKNCRFENLLTLIDYVLKREDYV